MVGNAVGNVMHPRYNEHGQHPHDIEYAQERPGQRNRGHDIEDYRYIRGMNMRNSRAMYAYIYNYIHIYIFTCICVLTCIYVHICICMYMYIYIYICICI
jgi:hypothetical protein